jgi:hypothetical protein
MGPGSSTRIEQSSSENNKSLHGRRLFPLFGEGGFLPVCQRVLVEWCMRAQPRDVPCQGRAGSNFRVFPIVAHRDGATNMRLGTRTIYGMWCQCSKGRWFWGCSTASSAFHTTVTVMFGSRHDEYPNLFVKSSSFFHVPPSVCPSVRPHVPHLRGDKLRRGRYQWVGHAWSSVGFWNSGVWFLVEYCSY